MSTKFFNNTQGGTLLSKLKGIAAGMGALSQFLAVAGYFRSSGYFRLRATLPDDVHMRILVGIDADDIFRGHDMAYELLDGPEKAKALYTKQFVADVQSAGYEKEIEDGILRMCADLASGRLELRVHPSRSLHAKFYLCLPAEHTEFSDGWVVMGSSNLTDAGLGTGSRAPRYELNVAMKDYDDVHYCHEEFERLWAEGVPLTPDDMEASRAKTYLGYQPTPYEIYLKILIEAFGAQVEDDFTMQLPDGVMDLTYQKDAVVQGYQTLLRHGGVFLADVVGLGKTLIAVMIAKRLVETIGPSAKILVVFPPALRDNWEGELRRFGLRRHATLITNGSLSKLFDTAGGLPDIREYDAVIVDEAHQFRSDGTNRYDQLQRICHTPRATLGGLPGAGKKVMLLSATPINNRPRDLFNLLALFQDSNRSTIPGIPSLSDFFQPLIREYEHLMLQRGGADGQILTRAVERIYDRIRTSVINHVTIRRTRTNILNNPDYRADLDRQGIKFPVILPPEAQVYEMSPALQRLFYDTLFMLTDDVSPASLSFARYRAIEHLRPDYKARYDHADQTSRSLARLYRVHMVKRLESSFGAFRRSLATLRRITRDMIEMYESDKVVIAPELNVKELLAQGKSLDEIIDAALSRGLDPDEITHPRSHFEPTFLPALQADMEILERLCAEWDRVQTDPKLELFTSRLDEWLAPGLNPGGKLVLFSESVDTIDYLYEHLTRVLGRTDVKRVSAANRAGAFQSIRANFDANIPAADQRDDFNILLTSDVLAEGVNLHRANVVVNYDSPWNATRMMQRIGRVNRIGSRAEAIHNVVFYPSEQGDHEINLYNSALIKLQSFHSAYGEDAQIFTRAEVVKLFELYDPHVRDFVDERIALLRELRAIYSTRRPLYDKVKALPLKSRVFRDPQPGVHTPGAIVTFVKSPQRSEFYLVHDQEVRAIDLLEAAAILKADPAEKPVSPASVPPSHYQQVKSAVEAFNAPDPSRTVAPAPRPAAGAPRNAAIALRFLATLSQTAPDDAILLERCTMLRDHVQNGRYAGLVRELQRLGRTYNADRAALAADIAKVSATIADLTARYPGGWSIANPDEAAPKRAAVAPDIIISETFV